VGGEDVSARDLARRVEEALARFGIAGNVSVTVDMATLHGNGPTVSTELGTLVSEWPALPEDARARRATELARRLSTERRAVASLSPSRHAGAPSWLRPAALATAVAIAAIVGARLYQLHPSDGAAVRPSRVLPKEDPEERERAARAARVCEATRSRIMRGASIGPTDAEGWVVELWFLRAPERGALLADPSLAEFVTPETQTEKGRITWQGAPTLSTLVGVDTTVAAVAADLTTAGAPTYRGARVVFNGRFVAPYFDDTLRRDYVRLVLAMTDALAVDYAALYARCVSGDAHHIGAWFRGPTPGGAVTSLLYSMGAFGDHPELRATLLAPAGATGRDLAYAFNNVANATSLLRKARIMTMLGPELGMIAGLDGKVSTVTFPFRDANRASRATHAVARELGIDEPR
jgi:serine/threonine-protein kinase